MELDIFGSKRWSLVVGNHIVVGLFAEVSRLLPPSLCQPPSRSSIIRAMRPTNWIDRKIHVFAAGATR